MVMASIPADTTPEAFEVLVDRWRAMTIGERVALIEQLNRDVEVLAVAGIRATSPELSEVEVRHELARRRFGAPLADAAFQDLLR